MNKKESDTKVDSIKDTAAAGKTAGVSTFFDPGIIAAGLAHEIRNPLSIIKSSAQFCLSEYGLDPLLRKNLEMMLRNVENANRVLRELIYFSKPAPLRLVRSSLNNIVRKSCELTRGRCLKEKVRMKLRLAEKIPPVMLDEIQMEGVLVNLMLNSLDAMRDGGVLDIRTSHNDRDTASVAVRDTGCGIPQDIVNRIFDPFVTSKKDGVGLGLAVVKRVVDSHGGTIGFESQPGHGTTFILSFRII